MCGRSGVQLLPMRAQPIGSGSVRGGAITMSSAAASAIWRAPAQWASRSTTGVRCSHSPPNRPRNAISKYFVRDWGIAEMREHVRLKPERIKRYVGVASPGVAVNRDTSGARSAACRISRAAYSAMKGCEPRAGVSHSLMLMSTMRPSQCHMTPSLPAPGFRRPRSRSGFRWTRRMMSALTSFSCLGSPSLGNQNCPP